MHIGDIVNLNNIVFNSMFKNGKLISKKSVDHAFDSGRPCIYIGEYEENMYFMSLSHSDDNSKHLLKPTYSNGLIKNSQPNVKEVIKKPIAYYQSIGYLTDKDMFHVFKTILSFHKKRKLENSDVLVKLARNYIKSYEKGLVKYIDDEGIVIKK